MNWSNVILKTTNEGTNWDANWYHIDNEFHNSIFFANIDTGYVAGVTIRKTINGGIDTIIENINDIVLKNETDFYPNPFNNFSTIDLSIYNNNNYKIDFFLYNLFGRNVVTINKIKSNKLKIFRKGLSDGIYYYIIKNNGIIIKAGKLIITFA